LVKVTPKKTVIWKGSFVVMGITLLEKRLLKIHRATKTKTMKWHWWHFHSPSQRVDLFPSFVTSQVTVWWSSTSPATVQ
jgi:hypothetical protein